MSRRVVITGVGVVSALGANRHEFWEALVNCRPGIGPIESVPGGSVRFANGAEVKGRVDDQFDDKDGNLLDRFAMLGVVAAREAVRDAGIEFTDELRERTAIATGSAMGGQASEEVGYRELYLNKATRFHPFAIPRSMANAAASRMSIEFGITGPVFTLATACSSSNHAIGQAMWMVRNGSADLAIVGGSEAPFTLGSLKAWEAMRVVSPDTCRPFSKDRKGLILGEGAAMLVLELMDSAVARGATIYAELAGFGMSADAHHITQPSSKGAARAMAAALRDAELDVSGVGYVNAHGTGTITNDPVESEALASVFGEAMPPISSTKSLHGHALGAAGALEAAATVLALRYGILPPTANFTEADPACPVDCIANEARAIQVEAALSNSFAFGGLNAVLAFRRVP
ncbi:MAG: beta-ketoacyl-[acyl-carrier-protein] synthase family protein [Bryobacteraceae bacterium]